MSGTSNTPDVKASLRPEGRSAVALPSETISVAPDDVHIHIGVTQRGEAVHRTDHATGRQRVDRKTVIGNGRAAISQRIERRIHRDNDALKRAAEQMLVEPVTNFGLDENRPQPFQGIDRHTGAREAGRHADVAAGKIDVAGHGNADAGVADVALVDGETLLGHIVMAADGNAVEHRGSLDPPDGLSTTVPPPILNSQVPLASTPALRPGRAA